MEDDPNLFASTRQNVGGWQTKHPATSERYCWRSLVLGYPVPSRQKTKSKPVSERINAAAYTSYRRSISARGYVEPTRIAKLSGHPATVPSSTTASNIDASSFSGLFTRVDIAHILIGSEGKDRSRSRGSGSSPRQ
jgi:hypothetical protein